MNAVTTMIVNDKRTGVHPVETALLAGHPNGAPLLPALDEMVARAVNEVEDETLEPCSSAAQQPVVESRAVLGLLVRCYVQQIYSSAEVAILAALDAQLPWVWWNATPDTRMLRCFRGQNRQAIQHCLAAALQFQAEEKVAQGRVTKVDREQLAEEARRRMVMAAFVDSLEFDAE